MLIPSPYVKDKKIDKDYRHSYVGRGREILGYMVVYSNKTQTRFHIYTQVTSPFGRGKGIGSAFVEKLAGEVPPDSTIYLYVGKARQRGVLLHGAGLQVPGKHRLSQDDLSLLAGKALDIAERMARLHGKDFSWRSS
ncbi:MAG: hypothetical protein R2864_01505 [Syntrophotaleaceae bacterium]